MLLNEKTKKIKMVFLVTVVAVMLWLPLVVRNGSDDFLLSVISSYDNTLLCGLPIMVARFIGSVFGVSVDLSSFLVFVLVLVYVFLVFLACNYFYKKNNFWFLIWILIFSFCVFSNNWAGDYWMSYLIKPKWNRCFYNEFHLSVENPYKMISSKNEFLQLPNYGSGRILNRMSEETETGLSLIHQNIFCAEYAIGDQPSLAFLKRFWIKEVGSQNVILVNCNGIPALKVFLKDSVWLILTKKQYQWTIVLTGYRYLERFTTETVASMDDEIIKSIKVF